MLWPVRGHLTSFISTQPSFPLNAFAFYTLDSRHTVVLLLTEPALFFPTCVSVPDASISWTVPAVSCWLSQGLPLDLSSEFAPAGMAFPTPPVCVKDPPMCFQSTPDPLLYTIIATSSFVWLGASSIQDHKQKAVYRCRISPLYSAASFLLSSWRKKTFLLLLSLRTPSSSPFIIQSTLLPLPARPAWYDRNTTLQARIWICLTQT